MNKKSAFTLAETIMTLFIVGVVITAAIPVFTQKKTLSPQEKNAPWDYCERNAGINLNRGLCGIKYSNGTTLSPSSNILIGGGDKEIIDNAATPKIYYDVTVNGVANNSSIYDIFQSDNRELRIKNYFFKENGTDLYITQGQTNITGGYNNVLIGQTPAANNVNNTVTIGRNTISDGTSNNTLIGINNRIAPVGVAPTPSNNLIIGKNNTTSSNKTVRIGTDNNGSAAFVTIGFNHSGGGNVLAIGDNWITGDTDGLTYNLRFHNNVELSGILNVTELAVPSDERLKNIKRNYNLGLKEVLQVEPVIYKYKGSNALQTGVIAQDIEKLFPDAVVKMPNGYLGINTDPIFFAMLNAMKEVNAKTNEEELKEIELQKEINELKTEIESLYACKADGFWNKIKCFGYDIKRFFKALRTRIFFLAETNNSSVNVNVMLSQYTNDCEVKYENI